MPSKPRPLPLILQSDANPRGRLPELGVSVERARRRDVDRPFHGVVAHGLDLNDLVTRAVALSARRGMPDFGYSHITAARLLGIPTPRWLDDDDLHVTVRHPDRAPRLAGVRGHAYRLDPFAIAVRPFVLAATGELRMLPVLTDAWLFATLGAVLRVDDLTAVADALRTRASEHERAIDLASRLSAGRPGSDRARRALALSVVGARSRPETLLRLMLRRAGLPLATVGHEITGDDWSATPDLAWPQFRVLVEYEGDHHRTNARQFGHDLRRFDQFGDVGWSAIRATRNDVFDDTSEVIARVARRLRRAGWRAPRGWRAREVLAARP